MTTQIRKTEEGRYIVYDTEDDFEYDEFLTYKDARDFIDEMDEICSDSAWTDSDDY